MSDHGNVCAILAGELAQLAGDFAAQADGMQSGSEDAAAHCLGVCERLGQVGELIATPALADVAVFLLTNIPALLGTAEAASAPAGLCRQLERCLLDNQDAQWSDFTDTLVAANWPAPMEAETATQVVRDLQSLTLVTTAPEEAPVIGELTLIPAADVSTDTLQAYFEEAPGQAAEMGALLRRFGPTMPADEHASLLRLAHTLKGSSALVGFHAISQLAHAIENAAQTPGGASARRCDSIQQAADMVELLIEEAAADAVVPSSLRALIESLYAGDAATTVNEPEIVEAAVLAAPPSDTDAATTPPPRDIADPQVITPQASIPEVAPVPPGAASEPEAAASVPTLHVPVTLIDENLRRSSEVNAHIGQLSAQLSAALKFADRLNQQLTRVQSQVYELETLVDARITPAGRTGPGATGATQFDPLELDEYTALHTLSRSFAESTLDSRTVSRELGESLATLQTLMAQHHRLGRELNESITDTRLVAVSTIVPRIERIVRQTARQLGREVELVIHGRELCIDTDILRGLVEPLMHALRNAIDHGIEPAEVRIARGKPAQGRIEVRFARHGNRVEVSCHDDGAGLDFAAIESRARERGDCLPGKQLTEQELSALVFAPGFSTRNAVSSISGRGVGMDVVRASIEKLKGSVELSSRTGFGCRLLFRLPLSLTSAHVLFVAAGERIYGLPGTSVEQLIYSDAGRIISVGDALAFEYGTQVIPLLGLAALLHHETVALTEQLEQARPLVLIRGDAGTVAVVVDRALASGEVLIKGLSPFLPALPGVAGASILADGAVAVILDTSELLRAASTPRHTPARAHLAEVPALPARRQPRALVVDDSLSARRTLAQLLTDVGYAVTTAVDGLDALRQLETAPADVLLLDMEMPNMDGLQLTTHLRNTAAWRSVPIIMITSRAAEKHRTHALLTGVNEYLTKPYQEHELLDRLHAHAPLTAHSDEGIVPSAIHHAAAR